jgi:nitrite reductase (NADH) large subunit
MNKERLVVIGNGMAGARLVEDVIALGGADRFDITMFGDEPYGNYNRILLSGVLAGTHDPRDIFINPLDWYRRSNIRLHAGVPATRVVRDTRSVEGHGGVRERFDHLVFATGSVPFVPPMDGLTGPDGCWRPGVFVFRTLDDCTGMAQYAGGCRTAAVIGGGLLGLEAARGLLSLGVQVHVVHLMPHLMDVQLDRRAGRMLSASLAQMGVQVHVERRTRALIGSDGIDGLKFDDGSTLACEMVVIAAGIRPNVDLARDAGLRVDRGIVVDDGLSCAGAPGIYAIGECAQHRGQVYGLVAPLWDQAGVLAQRLTARDPRAAYTGSAVSTKLKVAGVDLTVMGDKEPASDDDEVVTYAEPARGVYKKLILRAGRLAGAILLGDGQTAPRLMQTFDRGELVPDNRAELLFPIPPDGPASSVAELSDGAQICNCNGVTKGRIVTAVRDGCLTLKALCDATRAGSGCGSCKPQIQAVLELAGGGLVAEDPAAHYYVAGVPLTKPQLVDAIRDKQLKSVSAVFATLAGGREDPASKAGLASLLRTIWGTEYVDERDARFINDRVHANIQRDGTFSVVPRIFGGVTSAAQLRRIADVADKYQVPMVKITGGQRIDLLGLRKEQLPEVWRDLGMPSGHAYTKAFRTCKTCVGTEFCRYGVGDSTALGISIERRFQGLEAPHKMKLATAGCPRNCSEATTKDVGAVAIEGGRWEIYVGGAAGSRVRKGDVLCVVETHDEALRFIGRFMQYYREHARYLERTYDFVERLGIERLRRVLVADAEGIAARLDADVERAVAGFVDPWLEASAPVHPSQFRTTVATVAPEGSA